MLVASPKLEVLTVGGPGDSGHSLGCKLDAPTWLDSNDHLSSFRPWLVWALRVVLADHMHAGREPEVTFPPGQWIGSSAGDGEMRV